MVTRVRFEEMRGIISDVLAGCDLMEEKVPDGRGGLRQKWPEETDGVLDTLKIRAVCQTLLFVLSVDETPARDTTDRHLSPAAWNEETK